mmetsp:Transcript_42709/g.128203  ORF Transcript_42709/g.128203 Transcript_42709/m.128203 type:complete len:83 (-) Transcript_42709:40-288(-)
MGATWRHPAATCGRSAYAAPAALSMAAVVAVVALVVALVGGGRGGGSGSGSGNGSGGPAAAKRLASTEDATRTSVPGPRRVP